MPFLSQAGVDWFLMNANPNPDGDVGTDTVRLSLHTADIPSATNELTALSAPGYARQWVRWRGSGAYSPPRFLLAGPDHPQDTIRFGPATGTRPTVRSTGRRVSNGATKGDGDRGGLDAPRPRHRTHCRAYPGAGRAVSSLVADGMSAVCRDRRTVSVPTPPSGFGFAFIRNQSTPA